MHRAQAKECRSETPLQSYFQDINEMSLLSAAEERELADAIDRGDLDARAHLIQANLRLVVKIAREFLGRGMALDDLIGEGNLGLIRAAEDFDSRFGTRFSTYASYWIKQSIRQALITTTTTIRLPAHMIQLLTKLRRAERAFCRDNGAAPSFDEVATQLGLSELQRSLVLKAKRANQLKLESSIGDEDGFWSPDESMDGGEGPEALLEACDEHSDLDRRMESLDERERAVLELRFGLHGASPLTLKQIGQSLGVTREWVRKIELRAVHKLGTPVARNSSSQASTRQRSRQVQHASRANPRRSSAESREATRNRAYSVVKSGDANFPTLRGLGETTNALPPVAAAC